MGLKTASQQLYGMVEATPGTDPDATGAGYEQIELVRMGPFRDNRVPMGREPFTGSPYPPPGQEGLGGWSVDIEVPMLAFASVIGDGISPPALVFYDQLWRNAAGQYSDQDGEGVASVADSDTLDLDTAAFALNEVMGLYEADRPTTLDNRVHFGKVTNIASVTYDYAPASVGTAYTAAAVARGHRAFFPDKAAEPPALHFVHFDNAIERTLSRGKVTNPVINMPAKGYITLKCTLQGDAVDDTTDKRGDSLPAATATAQGNYIKGVGSPVYFNGANVGPCGDVTIDLRSQTPEVLSTEAPNGMAGHDIIASPALVTINPPRSLANMRWKRDIATNSGPLMINLGGGSATTGAWAFACDHAEPMDSDPADDQGRALNAIQLAVKDILTANGATSRIWQFIRG